MSVIESSSGIGQAMGRQALPQLGANSARRNHSAFVAMTPFHRSVIGGLILLYLVWIGFRHSFQPGLSSQSSWIFLALSLNFILLLLPLIFYRSTYGWFHPLIFNIFLTLVLHMRRSPIYLSGMLWHAGLPGWDPDALNRLVVEELLLRALGLALLYAGYFLSVRLPIPHLRFHPPYHLRQKIVVVVLFALMIFLAYMQTRGGLISHILSWGRGRRTELAGDSYWGLFIQLGLTACLSWLAFDRNAHLRPLFWGCTGISFAIVFLMSGSRGDLVYFMVMGLMVWLLREQKISFTKPALVIVMALLVLGLLGEFRTSTFRGDVDWGILTGRTATEESALVTAIDEVSARSSEGNAVYPILARVPAQVDFIRGRSYAAVLTLPIPRALWPEKPSMIGGQTGAIFFNSGAGIPPGPIGEPYWNFGIPGVAIVFLCFGIFYRWITEVFQTYAHYPAAIILYVVTLLRCSEPSTPTIVAWLIVLVLAFLFLRLASLISLGRS
ncbi:MAG: oligosaccharide repeat unit polymerase [Elainella sp. Prado103]|nr:oligosaccharide repeat unit polymerase [Elainella sp. Prado103]